MARLLLRRLVTDVPCADRSRPNFIDIRRGMATSTNATFPHPATFSPPSSRKSALAYSTTMRPFSWPEIWAATAALPNCCQALFRVLRYWLSLYSTAHFLLTLELGVFLVLFTLLWATRLHSCLFDSLFLDTSRRCHRPALYNVFVLGLPTTVLLRMISRYV